VRHVRRDDGNDHQADADAGRRIRVYECWTRKHDGAAACSQGPVQREPVDASMLRELRRTYLDIDAMRERVGARMAADARVARERQAEAELEAQRVVARLARVDADYLAGELPAAEMVRLRLAADLTYGQPYRERRTARPCIHGVTPCCSGSRVGTIAVVASITNARNAMTATLRRIRLALSDLVAEDRPAFKRLDASPARYVDGAWLQSRR
jgi:hypothetical protein